MNALAPGRPRSGCPVRPDADHLNRLIADAACGHEGAFDQVFAQLSYPVYWMALTVLRDRAEAEEVAQDVLAEIWRITSRYDPAKSSAVGWALLIARRRAIDRVRSITAEARRERRYAATGALQDDLGQAVEEMSEREQLGRALGCLSDRQRRVIELAFYSGYCHTDIAVILDLPLGTVKSRIRVALAKLRKYMETD